MSNKEEFAKAICELLKIWAKFETTEWPGAKAALEYRINELIEQGGFK